MNEGGMRRLLEDKFTVGAEASVAAGPVGRNTSTLTDAPLSADTLSWSRSRGLFAGIALEGATLRNDLDDNRELYGRSAAGTVPARAARRTTGREPRGFSARAVDRGDAPLDECPTFGEDAASPTA